MVLSPCIRADLTKSQETGEINVWKNTEKVALKMRKSLMKHHFVKTDHMCLRIKNTSTNYWQMLLKFASVANSLGVKRINSHQKDALPYYSAGSVGSTEGPFHRVWGHVKAGHSWDRGGLDSPSGCGPGSHKGCRWDISADVQTFCTRCLEWVWFFFCFSFVQSTWNHKTLVSGETYSSKRTHCTAGSQQQ